MTLAGGADIVAPAICYESLLGAHAEAAVALGATLYVASVAKSAEGIVKGDAHYPSIARRHSLPVLMANCVGPCDDFEAVGGSAIWNARGELLARLPSSGEGALLLDTVTNQSVTIGSHALCRPAASGDLRDGFTAAAACMSTLGDRQGAGRYRPIVPTADDPSGRGTMGRRSSVDLTTAGEVLAHTAPGA